MSENVTQLFPDAEEVSPTSPLAPPMPAGTYIADIAIQLEKVRKAAEDAVNIFRLMPHATETTLGLLRAIHEPLMLADKTNTVLGEMLTCQGRA